MTFLQTHSLLEAVCSGDLTRWRFFGNLVEKFVTFKHRERIGGSVNYVAFLQLFFSQTNAEVWPGKKRGSGGLDGSFRRMKVEARNGVERVFNRWVKEEVCDLLGFWLLKKKPPARGVGQSPQRRSRIPVPLIKNLAILHFSERRDLHEVVADKLFNHPRPAEQIWLVEGLSAQDEPQGGQQLLALHAGELRPFKLFVIF